jgi:phosphate transport system protein
MTIVEAMQPPGEMEGRTPRDETPPDEHHLAPMQRDIKPDLDALKQRLLMMASQVEASVNQALQSLVNRDDDLALRVQDNDDVIDQYEIQIDDLAIHLLAKAPVDSDLRFVTVAMKISQNLERVGDEAAKISKRARELNNDAPLKLTMDLPKMARLALGMLKTALDSFVNRDPAAARALIPRDKEVDALNREIARQLMQYMAEKPEAISRCVSLMIAARSLERVADHAKNVAEEVVYLCEARDIRHAGKLIEP